MSQYKRYPKYKDSGVEWLGEVPEHWRTASLRWVAERYAGGTPDKSNEDYWEDGTIPWLNSGAVNQETITEPSTYITEDAFLNSSAKWVPEGALLMALAGQGKTKGMVAHSVIRTTCNQSMAAIVPNKILPRYLYWWLTSQYRNIRGMAGDGLRDGLNLEMLGSIPCPLPDDDEQESIAAILDRETARIDALIEKKQRLIVLLKEKRQAVITRAVTKGLDPAVPMKDSGVEWLGEVPEHWTIKQVRHLVSFIGGGTPSKENEDYWQGNIPWVSPKDMKTDLICSTQDNISHRAVAESSTNLIAQGAVLIVVRGMILMHSAPVALSGVELTINQDMKALVPCKSISAKYLLYLLKGIRDVILSLVDSSAHGTRVLPTEDFARLVVPVPEIGEQSKIVTFIESKSSSFDGLLGQAEKSIRLLQEHRSALITAAVTGQIDVRGAA